MMCRWLASGAGVMKGDTIGAGSGTGVMDTNYTRIIKAQSVLPRKMDISTRQPRTTPWMDGWIQVGKSMMRRGS
jgi:hypothetical protein